MSEKIKRDLQKTYNDIAKEFSASRAYPWEELQVFIPYIKENFKILDLGCGNGRLLKSLEPLQKNYHYTGVDFSENLIAEARKNFTDPNRAVFKMSDMNKVNFPKNTFDMVFMIAAFHHLPKRTERLDLLFKINRWLKPGGYLFMTNWNLWQKKYFKYSLQNFWHKQSWNDFFIPWTTNDGVTAWRFYHSFSNKELVGLLKATGFELKPGGVYKTKYNIDCFVRKSLKIE